MDIENEIRLLKRRVDDLEGAVNVLSGHLGSIGPEVADLKSVSVERFDTVDETMRRLSQRLDTMNTQIWSLRDDLPALLGEALSGRSGSKPSSKI